MTKVGLTLARTLFVDEQRRRLTLSLDLKVGWQREAGVA
jgi:hypothetical protein